MEIVLATHNLNKVREFKEMLKPYAAFEVLSLNNFSDYTLPEETGKTFEENAVLKAVDAAKHLKMWVIADDSGLVVPALGGAPGVYSARYAGEEATDAENRAKLLKAMHHFNGLDRQAYYECVLALAGPEGLKKCTHGRVEGEITTEEKGRNGFGYDAIFIKHDYGQTFAEISDIVKNKISHRWKALERLIPVLESLSTLA